jgi:hypothetical protein
MSSAFTAPLHWRCFQEPVDRRPGQRGQWPEIIRAVGHSVRLERARCYASLLSQDIPLELQPLFCSAQECLLGFRFLLGTHRVPSYRRREHFFKGCEPRLQVRVGVVKLGVPKQALDDLNVVTLLHQSRSERAPA